MGATTSYSPTCLIYDPFIKCATITTSFLLCVLGMVVLEWFLVKHSYGI